MSELSGVPVTGRDMRRSAPRDAVLQCDAIAVGLRRALDRIVLPLARAADAFVVQRGWVPFGHARLADHSRERFDRSSRWVRDLATLGAAMRAMPRIAEALIGADGRRPIGRVAAIVVARAARPDTVEQWIDLARRISVRDLKAAAKRARDANCSGSPGGDTPQLEVASEDYSTGQLVRFLVPEPVRGAFDEALALHRAVSGREATVTSFVEALVGEGYAGPHPPDADEVPIRSAPDEATLERAMARATDDWAELEASADEVVAAAAAALTRLESCCRVAGSGGPQALDGQIRTLIRIEDELERHLGNVIRDLSERGGWSRLLFRGAGHYAEQRLGLARRTLAGRAMLARALRRFPRLREAYEGGEVGFEAALLVVRTLGRDPMIDAATEIAWVEHARECTIKRLRDERQAHSRRRLLEPEGRAARGPASDEVWHSSLRLEPGMQRDRVLCLGTFAARDDRADVFLRLRLDDDLAKSFLAVLESTTRHLQTEADRVPWDQPEPDPDALPSTRAARTFSIRCRRVPVWVGLLAMLEDYVCTWDDPSGMPKRASDRIYIRDGWRCAAPGCTSRRNLEDHHLEYRSRGGNDDPSNRITLCRFHHSFGAHGVLASCRGRAPLGILWRLGRKDVGVHFRSERMVTARP